MWHQFLRYLSGFISAILFPHFFLLFSYPLRQYLNQEHVIQKLADSKIIRSAARFFVSAMYGMRGSVFRDFWKRIEFFSKTFGEEFRKSLTQKK